MSMNESQANGKFEVIFTFLAFDGEKTGGRREMK